MKTYFECLLVAWIVNAYIYEYAAEALTEIRIRMPRYLSIDFYSFMRKPFPKVVKVCIELYRWPKDSEELVSHRKIVEMLLQRTLWCDKYRRSFPGLRTRWVWNAGASPNYTFLSLNLLAQPSDTIDSRYIVISVHQRYAKSVQFGVPRSNEQYLPQRWFQNDWFFFPQIRIFEFYRYSGSKYDHLPSLPLLPIRMKHCWVFESFVTAITTSTIYIQT